MTKKKFDNQTAKTSVILVVDDNRENLELLEACLEDIDCRTISACDGPEALDIIKPVLAKIENRDLDAAWHDWVMAQILLREARSLIENKPGAPEQPR